MTLNRKIAAVSARAHTRKVKRGSSSPLTAGNLKKLSVVLLIGLLALVYQTTRPPPPRTCGSPGGPPITASRIKLKDGRHLAYKEDGVSKAEAKHKIVCIHGFRSSRLDSPRVSQKLMEELGVYLVSFDRAGYGESDPDPRRTLRSTAMDIDELAEQLELGSKFYLLGFSMGGQIVWTCLRYIPHRLAGAGMVAPAVNYWWSGLPANVSEDGFKRQLLQDQWALRIAHYAPWLTYWWNTQNWFPCLSIIANDYHFLPSMDREILSSFEDSKQRMATQQGTFESLHLDLIIGFGHWEFSPTDLIDPFPNNEGFVHVWQGDQDVLVPVGPQRYIAKKLPWIHYHEVPDSGHLFHLVDNYADDIVKALILGM